MPRPKKPVAMSPAEEYAKPRRMAALSEKDGEQLVSLLEKAGFKTHTERFKRFTVCKVRFGDKFVFDKSGSDEPQPSQDARTGEEQ